MVDRQSDDNQNEEGNGVSITPMFGFEPLFAALLDFSVMVEEALDQPEGLLDPDVLPDLLAARPEILDDLWELLKHLSSEHGSAPVPDAQNRHGLGPESQRWKATQLRILIERYREERSRQGFDVRRPDRLDQASRPMECRVSKGRTTAPEMGDPEAGSSGTFSLACQVASTAIGSAADLVGLGSASSEAAAFLGYCADGKGIVSRLWRRWRHH